MELHRFPTIVKAVVEPATCSGVAERMRALRATLDAGDPLDWSATSQSLGGEIDQLLNGLVKLHEITARYWVDGVVLSSAQKDRDRLVVSGIAWCADHRRQWEVPLRVDDAISAGGPGCLRISLGDAALETLENHIGRSVTKSANPGSWLVAFDVEPS